MHQSVRRLTFHSFVEDDFVFMTHFVNGRNKYRALTGRWVYSVFQLFDPHQVLFAVIKVYVNVCDVRER